MTPADPNERAGLAKDLLDGVNLVLVAEAAGNEKIQLDAINKLLDTARMVAVALSHAAAVEGEPVGVLDIINRVAIFNGGLVADDLRKVERALKAMFAAGRMLSADLEHAISVSGEPAKSSPLRESLDAFDRSLDSCRASMELPPPAPAAVAGGEDGMCYCQEGAMCPACERADYIYRQGALDALAAQPAAGEAVREAARLAMALLDSALMAENGARVTVHTTRAKAVRTRLAEALALPATQRPGAVDVPGVSAWREDGGVSEDGVKFNDLFVVKFGDCEDCVIKGEQPALWAFFDAALRPESGGK
jgi:hypothetical protein